MCEKSHNAVLFILSYVIYLLTSSTSVSPISIGDERILE